MSTSGLSPDIIRVTVGDDDLLKNVDFASSDLAENETISSVGAITTWAVDHRWRNATATSDITVESNASRLTVVQLRISDIVAAGRYIIVVPGITSEGQVLLAICRLLVEGAVHTLPD